MGVKLPHRAELFKATFDRALHCVCHGWKHVGLERRPQRLDLSSELAVAVKLAVALVKMQKAKLMGWPLVVACQGQATSALVKMTITALLEGSLESPWPRAQNLDKSWADWWHITELLQWNLQRRLRKLDNCLQSTTGRWLLHWRRLAHPPCTFQ